MNKYMEVANELAKENLKTNKKLEFPCSISSMRI